MPTYYAVWANRKGDREAVQVLFVTIGSAEGRLFIALGGNLSRLFFTLKGISIVHGYTEWKNGLRIGGLPAMAIALGWMLIGQIVWLVEGRFLWPLILMGFVVWWLGDDLIEEKTDCRHGATAP